MPFRPIWRASQTKDSRNRQRNSNALRAELARVTNEGLVKQGAQVDAVLRAIKELPSREEFLAAGTRLGSLEQALVRLEQLTAKLHEKDRYCCQPAILLPVDDDTVLVRSFVGLSLLLAQRPRGTYWSH